MEQDDARYEVIFTLASAVAAEPRGTFRWTWVRIRADGSVTVRGKIYPTLRAAIDGAAEYRRSHGGGQIRVNLQETRRDVAEDAVYLG
jgi:hypothetical protein